MAIMKNMTYRYAIVRRRQTKMASNYAPGVTGFESAISGGAELSVSVDCNECEKEIVADINYDGAGYYEMTCKHCGTKQDRKVDLD